MSTYLTDAEKIRWLPWSIAHNAANSIFCTFTVFGAAFILFLDELGLSKTSIGFLLSMFPFFGILALFIAPAVARAGFKRTFIIFWSLRKIVIAFLLFTPYVLSRFGLHVTFIYVTGILLVFAICRAIGETAYYPWSREIVPDRMRGKYAAVNNAVSTVIGCVTVVIASYVIGHFKGLTKFMILFAVGVPFGLISVWCSSFVPGGAPIHSEQLETAHSKRMMNVLQDRNFLLFLAVIGMTLISVSFLSFVPLFAKERIGLSQGNVVLLQIGTLLGALASGYLWGWAADRYGSKPVMVSSLQMMAFLPLLWVLIPKHSVWSSSAAMGTSFLYGLIGIGWSVAGSRLLNVGIVPHEKRSEYMAIYSVWIGLVSGSGQLAAGRILDYCKHIEGKFFIFTLDPYTPIFTASLALMFLGVLLIRKVQADSCIPAGKFVGMFLRGNPFMAIQSLIRFNMAKEERTRVLVTEQLGQAKSPLNVTELLESLSDPSFNVRYEAIVSIARTRPDDKLVNSLIEILNGNNAELSTAAAWALGRIGSRKAIEPLRKTLVSKYPLLRTSSARALATLGDPYAIPILFDLFKNEQDDRLRVAYASALGTSKESGAISELLSFLRKTQDSDIQKELTLAIARIVGNEHYFIKFWRQMSQQIGTITSQAILSSMKKVKKPYADTCSFKKAADKCAEAFAKNDLTSGVALLSDFICSLPIERFGEPCASVLRDCASCLDEFGATRIEYIALSVHTINSALINTKE